MPHTIASFARRSRRRLLPPAPALVAALPAALAAAALNAGDIFEDVQDYPLTPTSAALCWSGDHTEEADTWTIRRAPGTTPPAADAPPVATLPGGTSNVCYRATGLVTDAPYTFRVTGTNASGEGEPGIFTFAARREGTFVLPSGSRPKLPRSTEYGEPELAVTNRGRRLHAAYVKSIPGRHRFGLYYSSRGKRGWSKPELVSSVDLLELDVMIASNPAGKIVTAW